MDKLEDHIYMKRSFWVQVVAAVSQQMDVLNTNARYLHEGILDHAKALVATMPQELQVIYFLIKRVS